MLRQARNKFILSRPECSFGLLTPVEFAWVDNGLNKNCAAWRCKCRGCGKFVVVREAKLVKSKGAGCRGCASRTAGKMRLRRGSGFDDYWSRLLVSASSRGIGVSISKEYAASLLAIQNNQCVLTGLPIEIAEYRANREDHTASLDRIDSSLEYVEGNVQWVHNVINIMKSDMTQEEFISWCERVTNHVRI